MKKEDISYEVTELSQIREALAMENIEDVDAAVIRLSGNMNDLLGEAEYADTAEMILEAIDLYDSRDLTRADLIKKVDCLIESMQADLAKADTAETLKAVRDEMKAVGGEIVDVIRREAKAACKDINRAIKRETPKCSGTIAKVKEFPKNVERKVRHGVKNWLDKEDEE